MVKTYHLIDYLKSGIEQNIVCNDDCKLIDYESTAQKSNSYEVEILILPETAKCLADERFVLCKK